MKKKIHSLSIKEDSSLSFLNFPSVQLIEHG